MNESKPGSRPGKHDSVPKDNLIPSPAKDLDLIEKKHQQIVKGACRIFFKKGYHRTTIREIAMASGMSMGQLYHYITSKDDVLFLVYKHMQLIWYEHLVQSGVEKTGDPLERLDKALTHTISFITENKSLFLFVYTETKYLAKRHLKVVLEMDDKNVVGFWRRLLEDFNNEKSIEGNLDFLANLMSYLMLFLPLRGWNLEDRPAPEHLTSLRNFILRGMGMMGQGKIIGDETHGE